MIDWNSLALVALVSILSTTALVAAFSLGMRWLTNAQHFSVNAKKGSSGATRLEVLFRSGAYALFTVCAGALIYGIYLIVPYFHLGE